MFCYGNHIGLGASHCRITMFLSSIATLVRSACTRNSCWIQYKTENTRGVRTAVGVHVPPFQASLISPPLSPRSWRFRYLKWIVADLVRTSRGCELTAAAAYLILFALVVLVMVFILPPVMFCLVQMDC